MVADVTISGVDKLEKLGKDLREAGAKDLQKELMKSFNRAAKSSAVQEAVVTSAMDVLPGRGGLAEYIASSMKIVAKARTRGKNAGIRLVGSVDARHGILKRKAKAKARAKQRRADRAYEKAVKAEEG